MPAWAYREQMTVALVSFAALTLLLPYITPPIVRFQLFGEKSKVCTLKVDAFMCARVGGRKGAHRRLHIKEKAQTRFQNIDSYNIL